MTAESSLPTMDAVALQETMGQICACHDRLEKYLREMFCNLGGLADEVARQERRAAGDRQAHETEFRRREEQLSRQREELESALQRMQDLAGQLSSPAAADPGIAAQFEHERSAWSQERAVLETELDCVRNRAAELTGAIEEERRRVAEERKGWAEELRRMRRLLETLADRPAAPVTPRAVAPPVQVMPHASSAVAAVRMSEEEDSAGDPVLDSVMAQFEILQKDLARRRKARPAVQLGS